jgi:cytidylate kinase
MAVITISRQYGAGGRTLGKMISERTGFSFADNEIIQMVAKEANVSPVWVENVEKEAGTTLARILSSMVSQKWIDRVLADERGYIDEQIYLDYLVLIIAKIADEGDVVILGRGAQYILNDHPDAYHILLIDDLENRIRFVMEHERLSRKKAVQVVNYEDRRRASLFKKIGKIDYDKPSLYHMVLNMGRVSLEAALNVVCEMIVK